MERVINAVNASTYSVAATNGLIGASILIFGGLMVSHGALRINLLTAA